MPGQTDTNEREGATPGQPMDPERLADLRSELDDDDSGPWVEHTIELLADRDHWRAMCRTWHEAYGDAHADIERLEAEVARLNEATADGCDVCGNETGDGERQCGSRACPHGDCLHNHHDGCMSCIEHEERAKAITEADRPWCGPEPSEVRDEDVSEP